MRKISSQKFYHVARGIASFSASGFLFQSPVVSAQDRPGDGDFRPRMLVLCNGCIIAPFVRPREQRWPGLAEILQQERSRLHSPSAATSTTSASAPLHREAPSSISLIDDTIIEILVDSAALPDSQPQQRWLPCKLVYVGDVPGVQSGINHLTVHYPESWTLGGVASADNMIADASLDSVPHAAVPLLHPTGAVSIAAQAASSYNGSSRAQPQPVSHSSAEHEQRTFGHSSYVYASGYTRTVGLTAVLEVDWSQVSPSAQTAAPPLSSSITSSSISSTPAAAAAAAGPPAPTGAWSSVALPHSTCWRSAATTQVPHRCMPRTIPQFKRVLASTFCSCLMSITAR